MGKTKKYTILIILLFTLVSLTQTIKAEETQITLEFFYTNNCALCNKTKPIVNDIEEKYSDHIHIERILVTTSSDNYTYFNQTYGFRYVPAIVIANETNQFLFNYTKINKNDLETTIQSMIPEIGSDPDPLSSNKTETTPKENELNKYLLIVAIIIFPIIILTMVLLNKKKYDN